MTDNTIAIENVVRVTLSLSEKGMSAKNVNAVALFSNDTPIGLTDPYIIAKNLKAVETTFGTNTLTTKMASAIFAQSKNILSGNGYLVVIPMQNTVSATAPKSEFAVSTPATTLTAFQAISNGALKITTGGTAYDLANMDFRGCASLSDVATVIGNKFVNVEAEYDTTNTKFIFKAKTFGADATLTFASGTTQGATDILATLGSETTTVGADASGETLSSAIARTKDAVAYCGVLCTAVFEDDVVKADASYVAGLSDKIMAVVFHATTDIMGACKDIKDASQTTTRCLVYGRGTMTDAKVMLGAYVGRAFSTNFSASSSSQTMNLKSLTNVNADNTLTETDYNNAKDQGVDLYVNYNNGLAKLLSAQGNSFFDVVYENMALKFEIQANIFNALATTATKVPQTEAGMSVLKSAVSQSFLKFRTAGVIGAGTWNGSDTFGDPETFRNAIEKDGFYVYSQPIASQSQSERESRVAPVVQGACKRTGAIHEADVIVSIEN